MKFQAQSNGTVIDTSDTAFIIREGVLQTITAGSTIQEGDIVVLDPDASTIILMETGAILDDNREVLLTGGLNTRGTPGNDFIPLQDEADDSAKINTVIAMLEEKEDISGYVYERIPVKTPLDNYGFNFMTVERIQTALLDQTTLPDSAENSILGNDGPRPLTDPTPSNNPAPFIPITATSPIPSIVIPEIVVTAVNTSQALVSEGQSITFDVTLSGTTSSISNFSYSIGMGSAIEGADFTSTPQFSNGVALSAGGTSVIVPAGVSSFTVTVYTLLDNAYEPGNNETLWLEISDKLTGAEIIDLNLAPAVASIEVGMANSNDDSVNEGQALVFNVTLNSTLGATTSMAFNLANGTASTNDYTQPPIFSNGVMLAADGLTIVIPAGTHDFTVTVATVNDGIYEPGPNETVPITIDGITAVGGIIDVNTTPVVSMVVVGAAGANDDAVLEGQNLVFNVTLSNLSTTITTLSYNLGNGTASSGADYTSPPVFSNGVTLSADGLNVIIPPGVGSFSVTVATINDGMSEPGGNETLQLSIGSVNATGQIVDVNGTPSIASIQPGTAGTGDDAVLEGQSLVFNVTLSNGSASTSSFAWSLGGGTAGSGLDYSVPPAFSNGVTLSGDGLSLIVPAGITSFSVTVATLNDGLYEPGPNETLPITIGSVTATGQIIDNNTAPTVISIEPVNAGSSDDAVAEGQNLIYTVTLSNPSTGVTALGYHLESGTATSGTDFTIPPTFSNGVTLSSDGLSLTIPSGVTSFTVTIPTINDGLYEPGASETIPFNIGGVTAVGSIMDVNTAPVVTTIEPGPAGASGDTVNEGQNLVFNVTLSNASTTATSLAYSLGGSATSGADFSIPPTFSNGVTLSTDGLSLIVPAGVTSFSATVQTLNDALYEPGADESIPITVGGVTATGFIDDTDTPPAIATVEAGSGGSSDDAVNEGQNLVYTVTLNHPSIGITSFAYTLGGGTATAGIDYSAAPVFSSGVTLSGDGLSVIVPANTTSFTISIPTLNDGFYEPHPDETLPLSVGGITATGAIIDVNNPPSITSIEPGAAGSGDDAVSEGQNMVFNVNLSNTASVAMSYAWNLGGGSAASGVDYSVPPVFSNGVALSADGLSVVVPAGVASFSISVTTINDGIYEPGANETLPITIGGTSAAGQIIDVNSTPIVTAIEPGAAGNTDHIVNEGQSLVFNVTLSNPSTAATTLAYTLGGGTASSGVDYSVPATFTNGVTLSGDGLSLIVPAGVTAFSVTLATLNDGIYEPGGDESVPISIGTMTATGNIADINTAPTVLTIEAGTTGSSDDAVNEGSNLVYTVTLSNTSTSATMLAYALGGGTASSGVDYAAPPTFSNGVTVNPDGISLNIPANVSSFTVTVATLNDGIYEPQPDETVPLTVGTVTASGGSIDVNTPPTIASIETGAPGNGDDSANEGQSLVFNVMLSNASTTTTSFAWSLGGGTATAISDYTTPPTFSNGVTLSADQLRLIVPAGITSFSMTVPTINDGIYEPGANETLAVTIGGVTATGSIIDTDTAPSVLSVEPGAAGTGDDAVNEGQNLIYTVSLSHASSTATTLAYSLGGGTAASGVDFSMPPAFSNGVTLSGNGLNLIVPAGVTSFTVTVPTINDNLFEPGANETVPLSVGGLSSAGAIIDANTSPTVISVEPGMAGTSDDAVQEGQNLVFHVTLSNPSASATTLVYSLGGGTATSGSDYTVSPSFSNGVTLNPDGISLNIPANVTIFSITVPTIADGVSEAVDESVSLSVGGVSSTGYISDSDVAPNIVSIEPGAAGSGDDAVNEGQYLAYTVTLSGTASTALSYAYQLGGGTATGGNDYTAPPTFSNGVTLSADGLTIIMPAGVASFTATLPTLNDGIYEPGANETVPLSIGGIVANGQIVDVNSAPTVAAVNAGAPGAGDDAVSEGQTLVFNVTLSNASNTATSLLYSLGGGTATTGVDFSVPPTFSNGVTLSGDGLYVIVPAGVTSFSIRLAVINDSIYEPGANETVALSVGGISASGEIIDINSAPTISTIEPGLPGTGDNAVNEGQNLVFNVTLSNISNTTTSFAYLLGGGTATNGIDYTVAPVFSNGVTLSGDGLSVIVPANVSSFSVTVAALNDGIYEPGINETLQLSIGGISNTGQIVDINTAPTVTTVEPGAPGAGDNAVNEGQNLVYTVSLSAASSTATTLAYSLGGGTASSGTDFISPPTFSNGVTLSADQLIIIVPAGVTSFTVTMPTLNDGIYEPGANETVYLSIGGISATGQIIDINTAPTVTTVELGTPGTGDNAVNEGQSLVYTVSLSNASSTATTLAYSLGGGTATSGVDYSVPPTFSNGVTLSGNGLNLIVPAGVTSFTVTVPTLNDNLFEPGANETVPLSVGGVTATGHIMDVNTAPIVTVIEPGAAGTSDDVVNEGQNLVFTITLSNPSTVASTLAYSLGGGSATSGIDYSVPPTFSNGVTLSGNGLNLIVPAGVTSFSVTVPTLNDGIYEPGANETVPLSVGGMSASGQIVDINTAPTVTFIEPGNTGTADDAVLEGQSIVYRVTLSNPSASATSLAYTLSGGTAASGSDYNATPTFSNGVTLSANGLNLIVPAGVTSFTVTVATINDGVREAGGNETLPLSVGGLSANGQIIDNSFYVSEEGLPSGNPDTTGTPTDFTNATTVSAFVGINSISNLILAGNVSSGGNVLTAAPVLQGDGSYSFGYTSSGNFIQVANFRLDGSGNFTFTLLRPLDHPVAGAEDTLLFPVRLNGLDIGLYVEDDSPYIASTFTQRLAPTTVENVAPVVNNPNSPNLLGLVNVGLPSVVVSADLLSAASATLSLGDYATQQAFTAYDSNNNLQKIVVQYNSLINIGLPAYTLTYSSDIASAFGLQVRSVNAQGALVNIGLGTSLEITSLDGGVVDNLTINQFLNTVHFNSSGLLSLDVLSGTTITATDVLGLSTNSTIISLASLGLLNPASYTPIQGGAGNDTLSGSSGNDQISGGAGNDSLSGLAGNDVIFGNDGNDQMDGGTGNDLLMGGAGNDTITGGNGNDLIYGGAGNDRLTGGAGNDFFIFNLADKGNLGTPAVDTITDFSKTEDYLDLRNLLQGENTSSIQKFISIENVGGNTILHISSNSGFESGYSAAQENQTIVLTGTFTQAEVMSRLVYDATALNGTLVGSSAASFGADGGYVSSVTVESTSYTYNAASNTVTSNSAVPLSYDANTHMLSITTSLGEKITLNVLNSNYSYLATSTLHKGQYSTLNYTLSDYDGDTSSARLEFAGQQAYPATAPQTGIQLSGSLLDLVDVSGVQTGPNTDLIDLKSQQIYSAFDINNNLQTVEIKYAGVLGLAGTYSLHASNALADQLGLHVNVVDTAAVTVLGIQTVAPTSTLTITAADGGLINNLAVNELLGTLTFTHSGLFNDSVSSQLLSAMTIKATDSTGLISTSTAGNLADISLLTSSQTATAATEGSNANDNITGTSASDRIYGYNGNDNLNGSNGNDLLHGGAGNDIIHGGSGNDLIIGGAGFDQIFGELGADVFRWELNQQGSNTTPYIDIIADFSLPAHSAGGDILDLRDLLVGESHFGTDPGNLSNYLNFSVSSGDTVIKISTVGDVAHGHDQVIVLQNVDLVNGLPNDQQIISNLLSTQKLIVD